jgi:hypothetical protein
MTEPAGDDPVLYSFEAEFVPLAPGTPAAPRSPGRPREGFTDEPVSEPELVTFECTAELMPPGTPAAPRPADRPREAPEPTPDAAAAAFARELAERVLEYVRNRPTGPSAEQLAALVQQFLARRSA